MWARKIIGFLINIIIARQKKSKQIVYLFSIHQRLSKILGIFKSDKSNFYYYSFISLLYIDFRFLSTVSVGDYDDDDIIIIIDSKKAKYSSWN